MILVNGVPLDNPAMGWVFRPGSVPYSALEAELGQLAVSGRDGFVPTPTRLGAPIWPIKVNTSPQGWEALQSLFGAPTITLTRSDRSDVEVIARRATVSIDRVYERNQWIDATFYVELTGAYWRAKTETTTQQVFSATSHVISPFPGLSAPVQDAMIRFRGPFESARVTDSGGSWVAFGFNLGAGTFCRFDVATGQAFEYNEDQWVNPTSTGYLMDRSGEVDFGGPRGVFEITPRMTPGNPASRSGRLTVSVTSYAPGNTRVEVRGKSAHAL